MQFLDQNDQLLELQLLDKNIDKCQLLKFKKVESLEHVRHTFLIIEQINIFLSSARTVSSSRDFGVEQFFRADEFRADDPSPYKFQSTLAKWP